MIMSDDSKNAHLRELEGAQERLTLHKVDLLDLDSVKSVVNGCDGVIHTASPVTDNPVSFLSRSKPRLFSFQFISFFSLTHGYAPFGYLEGG